MAKKPILYICLGAVGGAVVARLCLSAGPVFPLLWLIFLIAIACATHLMPLYLRLILTLIVASAGSTIVCVYARLTHLSQQHARGELPLDFHHWFSAKWEVILVGLLPGMVVIFGLILWRMAVHVWETNGRLTK